MADRGEDKESKSQKSAAESLRHQIDDLITGKARSSRPSSLRDFIDRKMAEDKRKKTEQEQSSE